MDTVTANVAFVNGSGDQYSDIAINDHPVTSLKGSTGWNSLALFGTQLTTIFLPATKTIFTFDRAVGAGVTSPMVFGFHFNRADNATFGRGGLHPGLSGSIFVDRKSGEIRRVDATATELDPASTLVSYASSISYGDVAIPDLGEVLAPVEGNVAACVKDGTCYKNELSFHDCRKFGSTARIITGAGND